MVEISIVYEGNLRCSSIHQPSGTTLITDAPVDNHGNGKSFSPTDLVATALGTCMLTTMGIVAAIIQKDLTGTRITVRKIMTTERPRRIAALPVTMDIPISLDEEHKQKLIKAAMECPVKQSLLPDIQVPIDFQWR